MATLTKAELADRVLGSLGVLAAGQSAEPEDSLRVQEAIDAAYSTLRKEGVAPFTLSAIPEWAQFPLRDYVIVMVAPMFGRAAPVTLQTEARKTLYDQVFSNEYRPPTVITDF